MAALFPMQMMFRRLQVKKMFSLQVKMILMVAVVYQNWMMEVEVVYEMKKVMVVSWNHQP
jgi:hypothetical protein